MGESTTFMTILNEEVVHLTGSWLSDSLPCFYSDVRNYDAVYEYFEMVSCERYSKTD